MQKILSLPDTTRLYVCHDYKAPGREEFAWQTTVGEQKRHNVQLDANTTKAEFVAFREERDATLEVGLTRIGQGDPSGGAM